MKKIVYPLIFIFGALLLVYIFLPNPSFPEPPGESIQSREPADMETPLRRGYFTNLTREEVINHYNAEFNSKYGFPVLRLNYPPEESQTIIRDQTSSTFLEELVHPFRESIFINGFEPKVAGTINVEGRSWRQKVIVKYVPSSASIRFIVSLATIGVFWLLIRELT